MGNFWISSDGENEGIFVGSNGWVGIGTNTADTQFEVVGSFTLIGNTSESARIRGWNDPASKSAYLAAYVNLTSNATMTLAQIFPQLTAERGRVDVLDVNGGAGFGIFYCINNTSTEVLDALGTFATATAPNSIIVANIGTINKFGLCNGRTAQTQLRVLVEYRGLNQ